jgi:hypothetical protein
MQRVGAIGTTAGRDRPGYRSIGIGVGEHLHCNPRVLVEIPRFEPVVERGLCRQQIWFRPRAKHGTLLLIVSHVWNTLRDPSRRPIGLTITSELHRLITEEDAPVRPADTIW